MSILVNKETKLLVQGITGREGSFHAARCKDYGTNLVAGVTPGKGGELFQDSVPVFNTVEEAITTNQPFYTELNSFYSTNSNEGISVDISINIPISKFILFADINYIYVLSLTQYDSKNKRNVGGLMLNFGLAFNL